ncbi:MAG: hypothetical protein QMC89_00315 [Candidatus Hodarchaeaceae archaeon]|nr:hypothetical protein [Candidatus Hodarchaeaceae archaeon]
MGHAAGDPRNGKFNVDAVFRAAGVDGALHAPTENHPIFISGSIDVSEETFHSYTPPNPVITVKVLKHRDRHILSIIVLIAIVASLAAWRMRLGGGRRSMDLRWFPPI